MIQKITKPTNAEISTMASDYAKKQWSDEDQHVATHAYNAGFLKGYYHTLKVQANNSSNKESKEMLPPGSAPIYTHSLEYLEQYKKHLKHRKMESNTIKMNYYDKIEGCREAMSDDWFGFILTMIMDVVSDNELSKDDTIELIGFLNDELNQWKNQR